MSERPRTVPDEDERYLTQEDVWKGRGTMEERSLAVRPNGDLDIMSLGNVMAKSGFFADTREAGQAIVKILAGRELGFGPVASMTGIYIVKGRITLSANMIAAAIKRSGRYNYRVKELTDQACTVDFYEGSQVIGTSRFTVEDAKKAELGGDNWRKYPRNMHFARAMSNGAKWYCADIFGGPIYTPDELGADVAVTDDGEMVVTTIDAEPAAPPASPKTAALNDPRLLARWQELWQEAQMLGVEVEPVPHQCSDAVLIERGRQLKNRIEEATAAINKQVADEAA